MTGRASVPASSANLGPGFDCLALALELRCTVSAEPGDNYEFLQDGVTTRPGDGDLVVRAMRRVADRPMKLHIHNDIPRSRGLGSSAAVTAAASAAALRAVGVEPDPHEIYRLVADLEGHCDNAAAAVYGGLVLTRDAHWRHLEMWDGFTILVAVPDAELSTSAARRALSDHVERGVAARTLSRLGFLIEGLRTGDAAALRMAGGDEFHEAPRADLSPITGRLVTAAIEAGAAHAAWSGAGTAAIVFTTGGEAASVRGALEAELAGAGAVLELPAATVGLA